MWTGSSHVTLEPFEASVKAAKESYSATIEPFTQLRCEHYNLSQYLHSSPPSPLLFSIPGKIFATFVEVHLKHLSLFLFEGLRARILSQLKKKWNTCINMHFSLGYSGKDGTWRVPSLGREQATLVNVCASSSHQQKALVLRTNLQAKPPLPNCIFRELKNSWVNIFLSPFKQTEFFSWRCLWCLFSIGLPWETCRSMVTTLD